MNTTTATPQTDEISKLLQKGSTQEAIRRTAIMEISLIARETELAHLKTKMSSMIPAPIKRGPGRPPKAKNV